MIDTNSDTERVAKAAESLGEHFDSVQIFCSRHESGSHDGTIRVIKGCGNWFARYGQVREWMIREDEQSRCGTRKENNL